MSETNGHVTIESVEAAITSVITHRPDCACDDCCAPHGEHCLCEPCWRREMLDTMCNYSAHLKFMNETLLDVTSRLESIRKAIDSLETEMMSRSS